MTQPFISKPLIFKPFVRSFVLCLVLIFAASGLHGLAAATPLPASALNAMTSNARAARSNASIYQWQRVNLEVRRIAASEKQIEGAAAGDADFAARVAPLRDAVRELRAGSQSHDALQTQAAAAHVLTLCTTILR